MDWLYTCRHYVMLSCYVFQEEQSSEADDVVFTVPSYACQRRTTLDNHNTVLTVSPSATTEISYICTATTCRWSIRHWAFSPRMLYHCWLKTLSWVTRMDGVCHFDGLLPCWSFFPNRWRTWRSSEGFPALEHTRSESSKQVESFPFFALLSRLYHTLKNI